MKVGCTTNFVGCTTNLVLPNPAFCLGFLKSLLNLWGIGGKAGGPGAAPPGSPPGPEAHRSLPVYLVNQVRNPPDQIDAPLAERLGGVLAMRQAHPCLLRATGLNPVTRAVRAQSLPPSGRRAICVLQPSASLLAPPSLELQNAPYQQMMV